MFIWIVAPDPDAEIVAEVIARLYPAIMKQDPKDRLYTLSVVPLAAQKVFNLDDRMSLARGGGKSPIVSVVCWQAGGFFDPDPAIDQLKRIAARDAFMANFSNFSVTMFYADMKEFAIAPPRHGA